MLQISFLSYKLLELESIEFEFLVLSFEFLSGTERVLRVLTNIHDFPSCCMSFLIFSWNSERIQQIAYFPVYNMQKVIAILMHMKTSQELYYFDPIIWVFPSRGLNL